MVKSTCKEPGFCSRVLHGSSQTNCNSSISGSHAAFWPPWALHAYGTHIHEHKILVHEIKEDLKKHYLGYVYTEHALFSKAELFSIYIFVGTKSNLV